MSEPLNIKLLCMYLVKRIWLLILGALLGALLFGGIYYLRTFVFVPGADYETRSELYLTYTPDVKMENVYINDFTWQTLAASDVCLDEAIREIPFDVSRDYLKEVVSAGLESDVRLVILKVTTKDPKEALAIADAYEKALIRLGERMEDIAKVEIFTKATEAVKKKTDNRTLRMSITGAVAGCVLMLVFLLLAFSVDDSVFLPEQTEKRYHIPSLLSFAGRGERISDWQETAAKENLNIVLKDRKKVYLTDISDEKGCLVSDIEDLVLATRRNCDFGERLTPADGVNQNAKAAELLKEGDGVIVLIRCGNKKGKMIERALSYLNTQKIPVLGCVLYDTQKKRLLHYLGSRES